MNLTAYVQLLVELVAGPLLIAFGWDQATMARRIFRTPTSKTNDLAGGPVEVKGRIDRAADEPITSPFAQSECVLADWTVREWNENGDRESWNVVARGVRATPFYVSDDHGEVLVDLGGATGPAKDDPALLDPDLRRSIEGEETVEVGVSDDDPVPEHIRTFVREHDSVGEQTGSVTNAVDVGNAHGDRRYAESRLAEGDEVYVLGEYDPEAHAVTAPDDEAMLVSDEPEWRLLGSRTVLAVLSISLGVVLLVMAVGWIGTNLL